ncbi:hypothetical protein [Thiomicrospira sp. WB1]|uniref:hypothetical protein n=1 Tax=Thiomicrospira sp. WB1 TaxID=1685380 RepID=UPI000AA44386|nr:hypothetical protein [Thiomicrospira sp. WB1]
MASRWVTRWVFTLWHYQCWATRGWALGLVALLLGLGHMVSEHSPWLTLWQAPHWSTWLMVVALTGVVCAVALESVKVTLLLMGMTAMVMLITLAGVGLLRPAPLAVGGVAAHAELPAVLAWVVVWMMVMSNGIHIVMTWLREMARGLYQHDALAEALQLTFGPVALSNLTTALGFVAAAALAPELVDLAWVVSVAAGVALVAYLSLFPWLGMRTALPFRVGNTNDRHGLMRLTRWMQRYPRGFQALGWGMTLISLVWLLWLFDSLFAGQAVWGLLLVSGLLLWGYWRSLRLALNVVMTVAVSLLWLMAAVQLVQPWQPGWAISDLGVLFVIPMGMILDDAIHYYTRYRRAERQTVLTTQEACHRYALSSVGRPIWVTSLVLMVGLSVLALGGHAWTQAVALVSICGLLITAYQLLIWQPARSMAKRDDPEIIK